MTVSNVVIEGCRQFERPIAKSMPQVPFKCKCWRGCPDANADPLRVIGAMQRMKMVKLILTKGKIFKQGCGLALIRDVSIRRGCAMAAITFHAARLPPLDSVDKMHLSCAPKNGRTYSTSTRQSVKPQILSVKQPRGITSYEARCSPSEKTSCRTMTKSCFGAAQRGMTCCHWFAIGTHCFASWEWSNHPASSVLTPSVAWQRLSRTAQSITAIYSHSRLQLQQ